MRQKGNGEMFSGWGIHVAKKAFQNKVASTTQRNFINYLLWPLSLLYEIGACCNNIMHTTFLRSKRLSKPVISVGNITSGGTGKTPFIIYLAHKLQEKNKRCAILTRGYGFDEVYLLKNRLQDASMVVNKDRYKGAQGFLSSKGMTDVFLMDDGFQHRRLKRDLDIVLINGLSPFGNGFLLPAGILRESLKALRRANLVVVTHADKLTSDDLDSLKKKIYSYKEGIPIVESAHTPLALFNARTNEKREIAVLKGREVVAFCGIGFAEGFRKTLKQLGVKVIDFIEHLDHEEYSAASLTYLQKVCEQNPNALCVTTEKDFIRNTELWQNSEKIWVLSIMLKVIKNEELLNSVIDDVLSD
ncbi:tetraacyldisaccharide 4'-kinase [Candidatus Omnitrophota bacterium]